MIRPGSIEPNAPADSYTPRWYDFLFGGKPAAGAALNPVKAAIGVFTPEVDAVESAIQPIGPEANLPQGWYDERANAAQNQQNVEGTGSRIDKVLIPVTNAGQVNGWWPADIDYNAITLDPRYVDDAGNLIESSTTARIAIKLNDQSQDWIVMSYNIDPQGVEKNDWTSIPQGSLRRIWIRVITPTADPADHPYLVLAFLKGISLGQGGGVSGGASSPSQSSASVAATSAQSGAGVAAPISSPSGGGTGGGTTSGGGYTSGGGTLGSGGGYTGGGGGSKL